MAGRDSPSRTPVCQQRAACPRQSSRRTCPRVTFKGSRTPAGRYRMPGGHGASRRREAPDREDGGAEGKAGGDREDTVHEKAYRSAPCRASRAAGWRAGETAPTLRGRTAGGRKAEHLGRVQRSRILVWPLLKGTAAVCGAKGSRRPRRAVKTVSRQVRTCRLRNSVASAAPPARTPRD